MHKRLVWLLAIALLVGILVSCQSKTPESVVSQPTPEPAKATATAVPSTATTEPTATAAAEPTATPVSNTPTATAESAGAPTKSAPNAAPTPTPAWQIPSLHSGDWGKGNPEARMVLVEYSDFQ